MSKLNREATSGEVLAAIIILVVLGVIGYKVFVEPARSKVESEQKTTATESVNSRIEKFAPLYCQERSQDFSRPYGLITNNGNSIEATGYKQGKELTQEDCNTTIEALIVLGLDNDEMQGVVDKKYWIDMSAFALIASIGLPDDKNTTATGDGVMEQYVYGTGLYIYVSSNKVISFQDF